MDANGEIDKGKWVSLLDIFKLAQCEDQPAKQRIYHIYTKSGKSTLLYRNNNLGNTES